MPKQDPIKDKTSRHANMKGGKMKNHGVPFLDKDLQVTKECYGWKE